MPNNNKTSDHIIAGVVTVGVGVIAGLAYAGYQLFSNSKANENSNASQTTENSPALRVPPPQSQPSITSSETNVSNVSQNIKKCAVCSRLIKQNEEFTLSCQHSFHKQCIEAQYILKSDEPPFRCPEESCKEIVTDADVKNITG